MIRFNLTVLLIALLPSFAWSQQLSERAVYERCYSKLIRKTPDDPTDPYIAKIEAKQMTGAAACTELLNLAKFLSDGKVSDFPTDSKKAALAKRVLASMHDLHSSWITTKTYLADSPCNSDATKVLLDPGEPALFFTRALFSTNYKYDSVVTSKENLRAIRTVDNPTQTIFAAKMFGGLLNIPSTFRTPGNGPLLGVSLGENVAATQLYARILADGETTLPVVTNYPVLQNQGGGILGSQAYIMNNFGDAPEMFPDFEKMPRLWAKYALKDLLCREIPVIKLEDAAPYEVCDRPDCAIKPTAGVNVLPFRQNKSCVQCHATMDQMIGTVRNLRSYDAGNCSRATGRNSIHSWVAETPVYGQNFKWHYAADPQYRRKTPAGVFMFRDYQDRLVNKQVNNLQELGQTMAGLDDLYICAAKRYYFYFTGIDVPIAPMTTADVEKLPPDQKFYRNRIVDLGLQLRDASKFNKNPLKLIQAIFNSPEYKNKDFNLQENTKGATP